MYVWTHKTRHSFCVILCDLKLTIIFPLWCWRPHSWCSWRKGNASILIRLQNKVIQCWKSWEDWCYLDIYRSAFYCLDAKKLRSCCPRPLLPEDVGQLLKQLTPKNNKWQSGSEHVTGEAGIVFFHCLALGLYI